MSLNYSMLLRFAREVSDFRTGNRLYYPSSSIIFMAFIGILCGSEDWDDVVEVCESSQELLHEHLGCDFVGIPSHDTFSRFFLLVKVESMEMAFRKTMVDVYRRLKDKNEKEVIAFDGKYMRGVTDQTDLNVVSAYATHTGLCLGQEVAEKKINEPEKLRNLLAHLLVEDTIITGDALHCQRASAREIIQAKADYLIIVKANQQHLYEGILEGVRVENNRNQVRWIDHARETTRGHGRLESRTCHSCSHTGWLPACGRLWEGIKSFGTITSERTIISTGETSTETRCFISSLEKDALNQLHIIRDHWKIENNLHWQLDVTFREDYTKMKKNQLLNLAMLRKMAMPVIKAFTYKKNASMRKKIRAAALKINIRNELIKFALEFYKES